MTPIAEIIDIGDLVGVVWTSLVAGIGICIIFSLAIIGFARAVDMLRDGNTVAATGYLALMVVAVVAVLVTVVFGVIVMTTK